MYKIALFILIVSLFQLTTIKKVKKNHSIGEIIKGDFNGDGKIETALLVKVKQGFGNPIEDGEPDEYEIQFSNKK
ncbi:hypothetical protein EG240_15825 [Paenimyroides tangerinum]|uniref:Uncharacterized protein n=1 Tax=Paenimyroides tangerinum TaxID=2488728 RepID=A0A3P3W225_9FLAO|nr:hypothetical protein [Paenimyroides tangerinum]RRJ86873.1 hypothetical protein EG240_15825 [Paenimyroides tangerinum]